MIKKYIFFYKIIMHAFHSVSLLLVNSSKSIILILILILDNYINTTISFLGNEIEKNQNKNETKWMETELELRIWLKCLGKFPNS